MALFAGRATPLHRQLKGLLLPGLPRGRILAREVEGGECSTCRSSPSFLPPPSSLFGRSISECR